MPWLDRPGYRLWYQFDGASTGPVLLLAHSLGSDLHLWDAQVAAWGSRFRILRYDLPGHGSSDLRPPGGSIADDGADALALLDHLGIARCHFCGLSLGGMIGQWLGAEAGDRLDRLVLCSTTARIVDPTLLRSRIAGLGGRSLETIAVSVLNGWLSADFQHRHPERTAWVKAMLLRCTVPGYATAAETVCALDLRPLLPRIRVPTLVVAGRRDAATPPAWNQAVAAAIPGARYAEVDAAHLANVEAQDSFTALVGSALD